MKKLILFMIAAAFIFSPWVVVRAGAGQGKPANTKHHQAKHHHQKHHKKS